MRVSIAIELTWKAHCLCVEAPRSWEQSKRVRAFWGVHGTSTPNTLQVHARLCAQSHGAKALPSEIALRSLSLQRSQVPNAHDMGHALPKGLWNRLLMPTGIPSFSPSCSPKWAIGMSSKSILPVASASTNDDRRPLIRLPSPAAGLAVYTSTRGEDILDPRSASMASPPAARSFNVRIALRCMRA